MHGNATHDFRNRTIPMNSAAMSAGSRICPGCIQVQADASRYIQRHPARGPCVARVRSAGGNERAWCPTLLRFANLHSLWRYPRVLSWKLADDLAGLSAFPGRSALAHSLAPRHPVLSPPNRALQRRGLPFPPDGATAAYLKACISLLPRRTTKR